jgi:hypothetical protein
MTNTMVILDNTSTIWGTQTRGFIASPIHAAARSNYTITPNCSTANSIGKLALMRSGLLQIRVEGQILIVSEEIGICLAGTIR